jgi:hypothetical protein
MATVVVFVDAAVFKSMVVVIVVDVVAGVAALAGVGVFCEASASRITNTVRKFAIVFRILLGNGPDQFIFHSNSICRSLASHSATVLSDMAGGCANKF